MHIMEIPFLRIVSSIHTTNLSLDEHIFDIANFQVTDTATGFKLGSNWVQSVGSKGSSPG
jgi:hypothetical protein